MESGSEERNGGNSIKLEVSRDLESSSVEPSDKVIEISCKFSILFVALESPETSSSIAVKWFV